VTFSEIVDRAGELLQRKGRISYRALRREFELEDDALDDLTKELVEVLEVAEYKDGEILVWNGDGAGAATATTSSSPLNTQAPSSYTPQHLLNLVLGFLS